MPETTRRGPGRPRSEAARRAILAVTAAMIVDEGYSSTTIEAIAGRAGVGKQTIYRWWPTKADVVLEAAAGNADVIVPVADHGSYTADLRAFLRAGYAMANQPRTADLLRSLIVEAQLRPEFGERFRATFLEPRRQTFAAITARAARRGDLPRSPSPPIVADIVFGTLWYRLLATGEPLDDELAEELVATLC